MEGTTARRFSKRVDQRPNAVLGLEDMVLSWTFEDIHNEDLFADKVQKIPERFHSVENYLKSFTFPLLEETRADLCSGLEDVSRAPNAEIIYIEEAEATGTFYYIDVDGWNSGLDTGSGSYQGKPGDIFLLSTVRLASAADLGRLDVSYILAAVVEVEMDEEHGKGYKIKVSKSIEVGSGMGKSLYVVFLASIVTNNRIWKAINFGTSMNNNMNIIHTVLDANLMEETWQGTSFTFESDLWDVRNLADIQSLGLNDSQKDAILRCISATKCEHSNFVKLVKGPPGTGKTKTVGVFLSALLDVKCRTLACAPTNVAVLELCSRLLQMVKESRCHVEKGFPCPLGDVVLFGSKDRMLVPDDLQEIFLDFRVKRLAECLAPLTGWRHQISSLSHLLEDCVQQYHIFLDNEMHKNIGFLKFLRKRFKAIALPLENCMRDLLIHLPRTCFSEQNMEDIFVLFNLLDAFGNLLKAKDGLYEKLEELFSNEYSGNEEHLASDALSVGALYEGSRRDALGRTRLRCIYILRVLLDSLNFCHYSELYGLKNYCLRNASLIFCTASSSFLLHYVPMDPLEVLVIDEAAQLKECESVIPLRLDGLQHVVLVGDERQLPSVVKSMISSGAAFGRSLFERLSLLGHHKHLLDVQYRMHPAISYFPNAKFYDNQIQNGPNVLNRRHEKHYLPGRMYGSYSFINIIDGREEKEDDGNSCKNMAEVAVVLKMVRSLSKHRDVSGDSLSVGVVSPYRAQVAAIKEKLGNIYETCSGFSVKVNSIDGFQGGEEDIIILSTVRANNEGVVGFLESENRTNVALTRARHCLWIVGNAKTLVKSSTIWEDLINDANERQCFFYADEDKGLAKAILDVKRELNQLDDLLNPDSVLLTTARWKVYFSDDFRKSFAKLKPLQLRKVVMQQLLMLADGRRPKNRIIDFPDPFQLAKQCKVRELYLIWMVDIVKNEEYTQVLKVWHILPLHEIQKFAKRLNNVFATYTDDFICHCKMKCKEGYLEVPISWKLDEDIIRHKKALNGESEAVSGGLDFTDCMENAKVSESLLLMKFYSLSSGVVKHLLTSDDGKEIDLPFELTDEEQAIIRFARSTFILGRSGTGKTTVLTMKLFQREQLHRIALMGLPSSNNDIAAVECRKEFRDELEFVKEKILRQVFVTVSPKLSSAIKSHISRLKSFVSGGDFSSGQDSVDMHDATDSLSDFVDIPDSFIHIQDKHFPLIVTFQKFLMILDGTLKNSFFEKFNGAKDFVHDKRAFSKTLAFQDFIQSKEVHYERFVEAYWPHFNNQLTKNLDPSTVYTQIISHIKGGMEAGGNTGCRLSRVVYVMLSESRVSTLSCDMREKIYDIFLDYEKKKASNGEFDSSDFVVDLHQRLINEGYQGEKIDFVYIDEVQDLTMRQISLFKYVCKNFMEGFVFAGDTAQTIARGIDFRFQDIKSLFYKEFLSEVRSECDSSVKQNDICVSDIFHLSQNFRTHFGILKLAQSVIDLLYKFFPLSIDILSPETSLIYGEVPVILDSGNDENAIITIFGNSGSTQVSGNGFGAEQVILVRDECDKKKILQHVGKQALVLTIVECKGLEFQDVLLYNFFGASPLKKQWRVIYNYMEEQHLLESTPTRFPSFNWSKHRALCSELKQLYVAITRTRQRLWICENTEEYSKPMFDYWKKLCLVQVRHLDSSLAQDMQMASSAEDWRSQGIKLFNEGNFEMAIMCFERAEDKFREKWSKAASYYATAERSFPSNPEIARDALRKAAEIYESIEKAEAAAKCYIKLKEYHRAGLIYRDKCGMSRLEDAGDCFSMGNCWTLAAEVYAKGMFISKCLFACTKGELFDAGLEYIEQWKENSSSNELEKIGEADKIKLSFLESCALHYQGLGDIKHMMHFVKAFGSMDLIRSFLKFRNFLDELMLVEVEAGNYMEAAEIARMKGNVILEADMLEKAGLFEKASHLIMLFVVMNSLWESGSKGWPLKKFANMDDLLKKVEMLAKKSSSSFYEFVCADIDILSNHNNLAKLLKQYESSQRFHNVRLQVFSVRKIIDIHLQVEPSKFHWGSEMISDFSQYTDNKMSQNYYSLETLVHYWKLWKETIIIVMSCLHSLVQGSENVDLKYEEFCLEYFGVRKNDEKKFYMPLNSDACWIKEFEKNSIRRDGDMVLIDRYQFLTCAEHFWMSEVLSLGMRVLEKLELLLNFFTRKPLSILLQGQIVLHMFDIAKYLSEFHSINSKHSTGKIQKNLTSCVECFFNVVFPIHREQAMSKNMLSFYDSEASKKMLGEVLSENLVPKNGKFSHGQVGRVVMLLLVSGSLSDELCKKIKSSLEHLPKWSDFVEQLKTYFDYGFGRISLTSKFQEALQSTFSLNWRHERDYISPHCFMYLVECLLFWVSSLRGCKGFFFSTKLAFFEMLVCQHWKGPFSASVTVPDMQFRSTINKSLEFIVSIVESLLFDQQGTRNWIGSFPYLGFDYPRLVFRLVIVACLAQLNSDRTLPKIGELIFRKEILSILPHPFSQMLQRSNYHLNRDRHQFLRNVAKAFATSGSPLVVVCSDKSRSTFLNLNALVIPFEDIQCKDSIIRFIFPKKPEDDECSPHTRESDKCDLREVTPDKSLTNSKQPLPTINQLESQASRLELEIEPNNLQNMYEGFWRPFDSFELEKLNVENLSSNVTQFKLELEESISFLAGALTNFNQKQQNDDGHLSREMECMLDDMKKLSSTLDMREHKLKDNFLKIKELLGAMGEKRHNLQALLDSLFLLSSSRTDAGAQTSTVSEESKVTKEKENAKSRQKRKGKNKRR